MDNAEVRLGSPSVHTLAYAFTLSFLAPSLRPLPHKLTAFPVPSPPGPPCVVVPVCLQVVDGEEVALPTMQTDFRVK